MATTRRTVKSIRLDRIVYDGEPAVHLTFLATGDHVVYDEMYNGFDAAVAMLPHIWRDRFSDDTKPEASYYDHSLPHQGV